MAISRKYASLKPRLTWTEYRLMSSLFQVKYVELDNPRGWVHFPLGSLAEVGDGNTDDLDYSDPEA